MILKTTQISWKLKEGTVLKYGPAQSAAEDNQTSEAPVSVSSESVSEVSPQSEVLPVEQNSVQKETPDSVAAICPKPEESTVSADKNTSAEKPKEHIEQSLPESVNPNLINPVNSKPVVDGLAVNTSHIAPPTGARWQSLPYRLRAKRADVFVDMQASVDYLKSLVDFLTNKGLDVKEYNDEFRYLPSDIILADASRLIDAGTVLVLQRGKKYIWEALLKEFGARLNGK